MQRLIWTLGACCVTQARMTKVPVSDPDKPAKSQRVQHREGRLKVALRANMAKRKAQVRARGDTTTEVNDNDNNKE
jgi:hypothetical protein